LALDISSENQEAKEEKKHERLSHTAYIAMSTQCVCDQVHLNTEEDSTARHGL